MQALGGILPASHYGSRNPLDGLPYLERVVSAGRVFVEWYLPGLVDPWHRLSDCSLAACRAVPATDPIGWLGVVLMLSPAALALALRRRAPLLALAFAWWFLLFLPVSNLVVLSPTAYGERLLYLPAIGLCLGLAWAAQALATRLGRERAVAGALALVALVHAGATVMRLADWSTDARRTRADVERAPDNAVFQLNLALEAFHAGDLDAAESRGLRALELDPSEAAACNLVGSVRARRGDLAGAESWLQGCFARGVSPKLIANYASLLARRGETGRALAVVVTERRRLSAGEDLSQLDALEARLRAAEEARRVGGGAE